MSLRGVSATWVLGLMTTFGIASATDTYITFGDSITRATGGPVNPDEVFDLGGCKDSDLDLCACARRLENDLGSSVNVINRGVGAERTDAGLARIGTTLDNRCGANDPGDCVAVVLMEGTNNITKIIAGAGAYSIESTVQDLEGMIDVATAHGVDVLLGAVPQRAKWNGCSATGHDATTDELNDEIANLAAETGRPFADVANDNPLGLCRNLNGCFQNHYYCGDIHIDSSGYDRLCDIFLEEIESSPLPDPPVPGAPIDVVLAAQPEFEWLEVADARWYQLEIDNVSTWHDGGDPDVCSGGSCSVAPVVLAEGDHSWRLRARNLLGYGDWSASEEFAVYLSAPQAAPEPLSPEAPLFENRPLYRWQQVAGAETYSFEVRDSLQNVDVSVVGLLADAVCDDGLCAYREGTELAVDGYSWSIRAVNPLGLGPKSASLAFGIMECVDESPRDVEQILPSPVRGTATIDWCGPLTAGALGSYVIDLTGDLTLHSRDGVELYDGFQVNGRLEIRIDR